MNNTNFIARFWAKTSHDLDNFQNAFHPLICHLIDVACVAHLMWQKVLSHATKKRITKAFGYDPENEEDIETVGKLVAFIAGLHDLGKCSPPFACRPGNADSLQAELDRERQDGNLDKKQIETRLRKIQSVRFREFYPEADPAICSHETNAGSPHGWVTAAVLPPMLAERFNVPRELAVNLSEIVGGHHGTFADTSYLNKCVNKDHFNDDGKYEVRPFYCGDATWQKDQRALFDLLANIFKIDSDLSHVPNAKLDNATAMILAGFVSVDDWIGSNTGEWIGPAGARKLRDFFISALSDYRTVKNNTAPELDLDEYVRNAEKTAMLALDTLGWLGWPDKTGHKCFDDLFPVIAEKGRRNLQDVSVEIGDEIRNLADSNDDHGKFGLFIVEAPMGEGKTEAAMYLADAVNALFGKRGIYFALPTQATSDQMFGRVKEFLEARFAGEKTDDGKQLNIQLMLAHGHASLSEEFNEQINTYAEIQGISDDAERDERLRESSNVVAAEWFTAKKRSTLVPFGVGTIDQILLAVLQVKHVFVRLFGLANKTVIIDEVHAYDAYMSTLLERLLEWLAALGSPVVILSATLPTTKRESLIKAYMKGLGLASSDDVLTATGDEDKTYPRISYVLDRMPEKTYKVRHLDTSDDNKRTLRIEWKDEDKLIEEIKRELSRSGKVEGCVAIICNTVQKAQDVYSLLAADPFFQQAAYDEHPGSPCYGDKMLDLLHARFRFRDRKEREQRSLLRFGKPGGTVTVTGEDGKSVEKPVKRPTRAVLVSTQIIEQSLDLDFDLMISELAPADLLLQRSGRLQRHIRENRPYAFCDENGKDKATFWLLKPELDANGNLVLFDSGNKSGLPNFGTSGLIYSPHILLRTWLRLKNKTQIAIPQNVEDLIEDVYGEKRKLDDEAFDSLLARSKKIFIEELRKKQNKAKAVRLAEVEDDDFYNSFSFQLDEDDPTKHTALRAQTRDEDRPTVSTIILTKEEAEAIDFEAVPDEKTAEFLIMREVKISDETISNELLRDSDNRQSEFWIPTWRKHRLLRHHRRIILDVDRKKIFGKRAIRLHDEIGVVYDSST